MLGRIGSHGGTESAEGGSAWAFAETNGYGVTRGLEAELET